MVDRVAIFYIYIHSYVSRSDPHDAHGLLSTTPETHAAVFPSIEMDSKLALGSGLDLM